MKSKIFIFLIGLCISIQSIGIVSCTNNLSHKSHLATIFDKQFILLEDCFLFQWPGGEYDISTPGKLTGRGDLPITIDDFLKSPSDWETNDDYSKTSGKNHFKQKVIGILKKGTKVRVVEIKEEWDFTQSHIWVYVKIEDGEFKDLISKMSLFIVSSSMLEPILYRWIKPVE